MRATDTANSLLATMTWGRGRAGSRLWQSWAYAAAFVASVYTTAAAQQPPTEFVPSYTAGIKDAAGRMGCDGCPHRVRP